MKPILKNTPLGEYSRQGCECSLKDARSLSVVRYSWGWYWKCHRCGLKDFQTIDDLSPKQLLAFETKYEKETNYTKTVRLPEDFTIELPQKALLYLEQFGITKEERKRFYIGFSERYDRLILPIFDDDGNLIYWQGRNLGEVTKDRPKYINVKVPRKEIYFKCTSNKKIIVLVEDIFSAIKVGRCADAYAIMYTYVPHDLILSLSSKYNSIVLWLDYDKKMEMWLYTKRFKAFGFPVSHRCTKKDPKYYNKNEIVTVLTKGEL